MQVDQLSLDCQVSHTKESQVLQGSPMELWDHADLAKSNATVWEGEESTFQMI